MSATTAPRQSLSAVLVLAGIVCAGAVGAVLFVFGGWEYYRAPLGTRGYLEAHKLLRPSGYIGLPLGIAGAIAMLSTLPYAVRRRVRLLSRLGTVPGWLEFHIFFGIVGPVLVTLHTSFKFNGIVSVGYWLMVTVWASGFIGRYLYVRIPRTIRGVELSRQEAESALDDERAWLASVNLPLPVRAALDEFDESISPNQTRAPGLANLFFGELRVRVRVWLMRRQLRKMGLDVEAVQAAVTRAIEHATLVRRLWHLQRTRRLLAAWHIFHRPLVYAMFLIVGLHVGVAVYLGYARMVSEMLP